MTSCYLGMQIVIQMATSQEQAAPAHLQARFLAWTRASGSQERNKLIVAALSHVIYLEGRDLLNTAGVVDPCLAVQQSH